MKLMKTFWLNKREIDAVSISKMHLLCYISVFFLPVPMLLTGNADSRFLGWFLTLILVCFVLGFIAETLLDTTLRLHESNQIHSSDLAVPHRTPNRIQFSIENFWRQGERTGNPSFFNAPFSEVFRTDFSRSAENKSITSFYLQAGQSSSDLNLLTAWNLSLLTKWGMRAKGELIGAVRPQVTSYEAEDKKLFLKSILQSSASWMLSLLTFWELSLYLLHLNSHIHLSSSSMVIGMCSGAFLVLPGIAMAYMDWRRIQPFTQKSIDGMVKTISHANPQCRWFDSAEELYVAFPSQTAEASLEETMRKIRENGRSKR